MLASLAEFLNPPALVPGPSDLNHPGSPEATAADTPERRDLIYLAGHIPTAELPVLAQVDTPLLLLYSRFLQGSTVPVGQQTIYGTPYGDVLSTDGARPHVQAFVQSAVVARSALQGLGMEVTAVTDTPSWQVVAGYLPVDAIDDAAHLAGMGVLQASERGTTEAQGAASNQWERLSGADQLKRILPSVDGSEPNIDDRIEIGVISDSMNQVDGGVADSQATGDLPAGNRVQVLDDGPAGGKDEGRAMAELVYDIGPEFSILFHSGHNSAADMAAAYDELRQEGADIITEDWTYFTEPVFQDGQVAEAVDRVYLDHGVLVFGSAGNYNNRGYHATWRDDDGDGFHEFADGDETLRLTLADGEKLRVYFHWSQLWGLGTTDIDLQLFSNDLGTLLAESNDDNNPPLLGVGDFGFGTPLEGLTYTNNSGAAAVYQLAFRFEDGSAPDGLTLQMFAPKDKNFPGDSVFTEAYTQNQPGIPGNHAATNMFTLGAVSYSSPNFTEEFSSHGPQTLFFGAGGMGVPEVREKPDFVAADGVDTSFFGVFDEDFSGFNDFYGTSAASPNAAAVAGLVLDAANRRLSYEELSQIFAETATGTGAGAWDAAFGEGLINAVGAGLVARGFCHDELYAELNPFGDYSNSGIGSVISDNTDTDGYTFAFDSDGQVAIGIQSGGSVFEPGLILWNSESASFVEIDYHDAGWIGAHFYNARIERELASGELYQAEVFEGQPFDGTSEYCGLVIDGPDPQRTAISVSAAGDGGARGVMEDRRDTDYFTIVAPQTAGNELTVILTPEAPLNAVLTLYDADGHALARQDAGAAGQAETIEFANIVKGATYYLRVGAAQYNSAGAYDLEVAFEMALPSAMTDAEGFAYFHSDGASHDSQTFSDFSGKADITDDVDVDSFFFAGEVAGDYAVAVTPLSGDVAPLVAVYDAASGELLGATATASQGTTRELRLPLAAWRRYIVAVADDDHSGTGDVEIVIQGPEAPESTLIAINAGGMGSSQNNELEVPEDSDFFRFTAPADADGTLTVTISPSWIGLDVAAILFDAAGNELAKSYLLGGGEDEVIAFGGVTPSTTYYLTVLSKDYADEGQYDVSVQFGLIRGSICGTKFYDLDLDHVPDDGEPGLAGWLIYADRNLNHQYDPGIDPFDETDLDGQYELENLPLGTLEIRELPKTGWILTAPVAGFHSIELTLAAPNAVNLDFGNYAPPQIQGTKWDDLDGDGVRDLGEPGLAGWTIYVDLNRNGQLDPEEPSTLTNAEGEYWLAGLSPGTYVVGEVIPANWVQTFPVVATECVSVDSAGNPGADSSQSPAISADGRFVAFASSSANLVPNDTNGWLDIFVFDRQTQTMERVSVDSAGQEGNQQSLFPSISTDGQFVAFYSIASNLVPGDTNDRQDVFVFDRQTRTIERVSVDSAGNQANESSLELSISGDGRFVAFESMATNLVAQDTNNQIDIFVFDRQTRTTERVSVSGAGAQANGESRAPAISADGRFVAFRSLATNLVAGDTNGKADVFVFDRQTGAIERVSVSSAGTQANGDSFRPATSADGRFVAFRSAAGNLVPGDTNGRVDVFVFDRQTRTIERVSVDSAGNQADASSYDPALNAGGNFVGFGSDATNLAPGDTNGRRDIFLFDRQTGAIERVSVSSAGDQADDLSYICSLSADGRSVAFNSSATNLVPGDANGTTDIFVRSRSTTHQAKVQDGPPITGLDFGNYQYSTVSGLAFNDLDEDGLRDQGEPGLDGWEMFVDLGGDGTRNVGDPWDTVHADGLFTITNIPPGTYRLRHSSQVGWAPIVPADDYYEITFLSGSSLDWRNFAERELLDFGDAPAPYPTTLAEDGPRHRVTGSALGPIPDAESDGRPSAAAEGDDAMGIDDEEGITFLTALVPGQLAEVRAEAFRSGRLDAWLDFNRDGDWDDAAERIADHEPLGPGPTTLSFDVPGWSVPGVTYGRFRFSTDGVASYTGAAADGEVEDYRVTIENPFNLPLVVPPLEDYGPMNQFGDRNVTFTLDSLTDRATWRFTTKSGGPATFTAIGNANSGLDPLLTLYNGSGDLVAVGTSGSDLSQCVLSYTLTPGVDEIYTLLVQDAERDTAGIVQSFFDTPTVWAIDAIAVDAAGMGTAGGTLMTCTIPPLADVDYYRLAPVGGGTPGLLNRLAVKVTPLESYRLEFQLFDGLGNPVGDPVPSAVEGQSAEQVYTGLSGGQAYVVAVFPLRFEDHPVGGDYRIDVDVDTYDFGDAPESYSTLSAGNGPSHLIVPGLHLGSSVDNEWEGQPTGAADGDDTSGADDEDGVVFLEAMSPGHPTDIQVTASAAGMLDAWIDFIGDGDFQDPIDHTLVSEPLLAGANHLTIHVPVGAVTGPTYARFRFSSSGGLSSGGAAADGEVEDYQVSIEPSGEIRGVIWDDDDGDGTRGSQEAGLPGMTVYLDDDNDGQFDPSSEQSVETDSGGNYAFLDVPPGNYNVAQVLQPHGRETFPVVVPEWVYVLELVDPGDPQPNLFGPFPVLPAPVFPFPVIPVEILSAAGNTRYGVEMLDFDLGGGWGIPENEVFPEELAEGVATDIEIGPGGDVYVSVDGLNQGPDRIVQFTYDMEFVRVIELPADSGQSDTSYPFGFDVLPNGNLLVAQPNSERIVELDPDGTIAVIVDLPAFHPSDVGVRSDGRFAFCEEGLLNVRPDDLMWVASDAGTVLRNVAGAVFAERQPSKEALEAADESLFMVGDGSHVLRLDADGNVLAGCDAGFNPIFQWVEPDRQVFVNALAVARNEVPYGDGPVRGGAGARGARIAMETAAKAVNNGGGAWNVTVAPDQVTAGVDFGVVRESTASGVKFNDLDGDGIHDSAEPGLDGWIIWADLDDDGVRDGREPFATTAGGGLFTLEGILPGTYKIREEAQAGWAQTAPSAGYHEVQFTSGSTVTGLEFGNRQLFHVFVVNSTADPGDGTPNAAELTLREAITAANAADNLLEPDWILFAIPADDPGHVYYRDDGVAGQVSAAQVTATTAATDSLLVDADPDWPHSWFTIRLAGALPAISEAVAIDGYTQPGARANRLPIGSDAVLRVELDGSNAGSNASGLWVTGNGATIRGLAINRFRGSVAQNSGSGIYLDSGDNHVIEGNFIGTDIAGMADLGNATEGVYLRGSSGNLIGGTRPAARNVISGNNNAGVNFFLSSAGDNLVQGNYIGLNAAGAAALGNTRGIVIQGGASFNTIGGTTRGARNLISGNSGHGVDLSGFGGNNLVLGNFIGTDANGNIDLGNSQNGINVEQSNNTIGGTTPEACNVISGNNGHGVRLKATGNLIQGNFIGTSAAGTAALGNGGSGVQIVSGASNNTIGGTTSGAGNVLSANGRGVSIQQSAGNRVLGNLIGVQADGASPLGNTYTGVEIIDASDNVIGGTESGAGNTIAYNGFDGIYVLFAQSGTGNAILGNRIYSNTQLGIDLSPNNVSPNDPGDADTGANNLQNFPVLTSFTATASSTNVQGTLNSTANTGFRIELFANAATDPTGFGEGQVYLGSIDVTTDAAGLASFAADFPTSLPSGQFVTATATVLRSGSPPGFGDTSEFSQAVPVTFTTGEIRGRVWHDLDTDGSRGTEEPGLAGWTVFLDEDDDLALDYGEPYTATDAGGNYAFTDLAPGNYNVAEALLPNWLQTMPVVVPEWVYVVGLTPMWPVVGSDEYLSWVKIYDFDLNLLETHFPAALQGAFPNDIEIGPGGDVYVLVDGPQFGDDRIVQFTYDLEFVRDIDLVVGSAHSIGFDVLADGSLLVVNLENSQWERLNPDGSVAQTGPAPLPLPWDVGMTSDGFLVANHDGMLNVRPDDLYWASGRDRTVLQDILGNESAERPGSTEALETSDGSLFMVDCSEGGVGYGGHVLKLNAAGEELESSPMHLEGAAVRSFARALAVARNEAPYGLGPVRNGAAAEADFRSLAASAAHAVSLAPAAPGPIPTGRGNWSVVIEAGQVVQGVDFGIVELSSASGLKYYDRDGDGTRDQGEPGLDGWRIWADLDDDGLCDGREPSATTANGGLYTIAGILPGTCKIREEAQPAWSPTNPAAGFHEVHFLPGSMVENLDLANYLKADFGDAPTSYATLFADNGAYHAVVANVHLGLLIDPEPDGQPSLAANKDDLAGEDDEDGVVFTSALLIGQLVTVDVRASIDGLLNAWLDFNRDGDFADDGEQVFADKPLAAGVNHLNFGVPIWAIEGDSFARFRFSTQAGLSFAGPAPDGEVEDYQVPIAKPVEIHGSKWNDLDADGVWDEGEPALEGWTIFLDLDADGQLDDGERSATTDASGDYAFAGLEPGSYFVSEVLQAGWEPTYPSPIERVSVDSAGNEANGSSGEPSISADGRFVAFSSLATNLVPGEEQEIGFIDSDIFIFDRQLGVIERVSADDAGTQANSFSFWPSISADGRFVAFGSAASNLVPGDTNGEQDGFVVDRQTGTIERVSVDNAGNQGDSGGDCPSISADGRFVAFASWAPNLVAGDTNHAYDIFVFDRQTDTIERVSVDNAGNEGDHGSDYPSISADGRFIAFVSDATDLVPGDTNRHTDIFVFDRQTRTIERVSVDSADNEGDGDSVWPSISADGRFVAFPSAATNLVAGDTNGQSDVFVAARLPGHWITLLSGEVASGVDFGNSRQETPPVADPDGPYVLDQGADLELDASGSFDPEEAFGDSIVAFEWDLDNDGQFDDAFGEQPVIPWQTIRSLMAYPADPTSGLPANPIGLRVVDSYQESSVASTTATIFDNRPVADFSATPAPAACNQTIAFDAGGSYHGRPDRSIVLYEWDFDGDGIYDLSSTSPTATHIYTLFGSYTPTLRVTDNNTPPKTDTASLLIDFSLGTVDFRQLNGLSLAGGSVYYVLETAHTGFLTLEVLAPQPPKSARIKLYDQDPLANPSLVPLVASTLVEGNQRVDLSVTSGQTYFVELYGANPDFDLRIANLVYQSGTELAVFGTAGDDTFEFSASSTRSVSINGVKYRFADADVATVGFDGGEGYDKVSMFDSPGDETLEAWSSDTAVFANSAADTVPDFTVTVRHYEEMHVYASSDGYDTAKLYGTLGNDKFKSEPMENYAKLYGGAQYNRVKFFDRVDVYAGNTAQLTPPADGGNDLARIWDSDGDDTFRGGRGLSEFLGPGFDIRLHDYRQVCAYGTNAGNDIATLVDSALKDELQAKPHKSEIFDMTTGGDVYKVTVRGFGMVKGEASNTEGVAQNGGRDKAKLWGTVWDDFVQAAEDWLHYDFSKDGNLDRLYEILAFESVTVRTTPGGKDTKNVTDPLVYELLFEEGWETP